MRFLLVNANNDEIINDFGNESVLSLTDLPEFNIVAEPETEGVQNVVFELNGTEFSTDSTAPFSLGEDIAGDFQPLSLEPGEYTLVATPFVLSGGNTVAGTPFEVSFTVVDDPEIATELNIEAEAEAEAEAETEAEVADGIAAGAVATSAGAAAFGNNAIAETATSGSISLDTRIPAARVSLTGSETTVANLSDGNLLRASTIPSETVLVADSAANSESSTDVSVISAEAEAEAETESEVEVEITNGAASATGGSAASAAAVGTNIVLFDDGSSRPVAGDTETATSVATSTSTSVSPVLLLFTLEQPEPEPNPNESIIASTADALSTLSTSTAAVATSEATITEEEKIKDEEDKSEALPVLVLDTEAEVAEAEAEAEDESGAIGNSMAAGVVTAPGVAAAAVSGGTGVAVAGDFAVASAGSSVATSTSTSAVTQGEFDIFGETQVGLESLFDGETDSGTESSESAADVEGGVAISSADGGKKDKDETTITGRGLFEAEAEAEAEAEVEAEVGNNSAAVASIANGSGGAAGLAATAQISTSSTASTSTQFDLGEQTRQNDEINRDKNRFEGSADFADRSIAEVESEVEAEASIGENQLPLTSAAANNFTLGDATAESTTTLKGSTSSIPGGDTLGTTSIAERTPPNETTNPRATISGDGEVVGTPGNLEIEVESELEAEVKAEISFNAAAAGASAVAVQAENGFLPTPAEGATATSSSTSVFDNGENRFDDKDTPGPAPAGERGGIPVPNVGLSDLVFEIETEAEAKAEVGFNAGAAAAAASVAGKESLVPETEILTTPFAAAAASGAAPVVELEIFAPEGGASGEVIARARAFDPEGGAVAVAVAVAGVPIEDGIDNEKEDEAEEFGEAIVEVSIFTDPANAANLAILSDTETPGTGEDGEPEGTDSTFESESEAETEAEAKAGYGVGAAAASSWAAGLFSDASAKTSTSTLPLLLPDSGDTILGTSGENALVGTERGDFIAGLEGSDELAGNGGNDLFVYDSLADGTDTIIDFEVGSDQIVLTTLLARFDITSSDPLADGFVIVSEEKTGSLVSIDTDGSGTSQAQSLVLVENVAVDELHNLANFAA